MIEENHIKRENFLKTNLSFYNIIIPKEFNDSKRYRSRSGILSIKTEVWQKINIE